MSLKCSVFGHQFGETDVTREREEQGSEVVITITETETCERCGETRVVSENKEVTTLETPDIVGDDPGDDGGTDGSGSTDEPAPADDPVPTAGDDPIEEDEGTLGEAESPGEATVAVPEGGEGHDDAVILDDEEGHDGSSALDEWPGETEGADRAPDATPGELRPIAEEQPDGEPTIEALTVPDGKFHCTECGFTTAAESSSLREGDYCPECHRAALIHRSDEE